MTDSTVIEYRCGECGGPYGPLTAVESWVAPSPFPYLDRGGLHTWTRYALPCGHGSFVRADFGELDLGIVREQPLNTPQELEIFAAEFRRVVSGDD